MNSYPQQPQYPATIPPYESFDSHSYINTHLPQLEQYLAVHSWDNNHRCTSFNNNNVIYSVPESPRQSLEPPRDNRREAMLDDNALRERQIEGDGLSEMILTVTYDFRYLVHSEKVENVAKHPVLVKLKLGESQLYFHPDHLPVTQSIPYFSIPYSDIYAVFRSGLPEQFKIMVLPIPNTSHLLTPEESYITILCDNMSACNRWISALTKRITHWTSETPGKALIFVNPKSGARGDKLYNKVLFPLFRNTSNNMPHLFSFTHFETKYYNHAFALISEGDFIYDYNVIVAIGGDGLVHEIVNALRNRSDAQEVYRKLSIAVIPAGTNNSLAMTLNADRYPVPTDIDHHTPSIQYRQLATLYFAMIIKGQSLPMDVLEYHQNREKQYAVCTSIVGFFSDIVHFSDKFKRYRLHGDTSYLLGALKAIAKNHYFRARIQYIEGNTEHKLLDKYFPEYKTEEHSKGQHSPSDRVKVIEGEFLFIATVNNNHLDRFAASHKKIEQNVLNDGEVELLWVSKCSKHESNLSNDAVPLPRVVLLRGAFNWSRKGEFSNDTRLQISRVKTRAYKIEFLDPEKLPQNISVDGESMLDMKSTIFGEVHKSMVHVMVS